MDITSELLSHLGFARLLGPILFRISTKDLDATFFVAWLGNVYGPPVVKVVDIMPAYSPWKEVHWLKGWEV